MEKRRPALILLVYFIHAAGLSLYLQVVFQSSRFTILDHTLRVNKPLEPALTFMISAFLLSLWVLLAKAEAGFLNADFFSSLRSGLRSLLPLSFFWLSPLLLHHYTTRQDLKTRLTILGILIMLAVFYLKLGELDRFSRRLSTLFFKWEAQFALLPLKKKLMLLFLASFLVYQAATLLLVLNGITFSGDEPNYLLTSHSLLADGDINLADNFADQDYFAFYSKKDNPRLKLGVYGRYGRKGHDYIYPINLPGISILMLPFYWLSQFFSGKTLTFILKGSLSVWAVLLGLQVYLYTLEVWRKERLSLLLWFLYSFTAPVLFYATHLYPEIPIALFSLFVFRKVSGGTPLTRGRLLFLGFLLGLFPWFGLKYNFIFWPLLIYSLFHLLKTRRAGKRALLMLAFPALSMLLFYGFTYQLYGTISPISIYEGVMTQDKVQAFKETALGIPLMARLETFFDYFLDQRDGLLLYSPLYFFAFLGFVEIFRRARGKFWALLFIVLPFILNYAFFTHRQGYSPQARVLTPVSWVGAVAVGYFLVHNRKRIFSFLFGFSGFLSLAVAGILLRHPSFLYQPTTHDFTSRPGDLFVFLSNLHFFLPPLFPSFLKIRNIDYLPNYIWIATVFVFVLAYVFLKKDIAPGRGFHAGFTLILMSGLIFLQVLYPRTVPYPAKTIVYSPQRSLGFYLFPAGRGVVAKKSGDFYLHFEKPYKFLFGSRTKLEKIKLVFGSEKGDYDLRMDLFDMPLFEGRTSFETREFIFEPEASYALKNLHLYEITLRLKHRTSEPMLLDPFLFQVIPWR